MLDVALRPFKLLSMLLFANEQSSTAFHFSPSQHFVPLGTQEMNDRSARRHSGHRIRMKIGGRERKAQDIDDMIFKTTMEWFNEDEDGALEEKFRYAGILLGRGEKEQAEQLCRQILDHPAWDLECIDTDVTKTLEIDETKRLLAESLLPDGDIYEKQASSKVVDGTLDEAEELLEEVLSTRKKRAKIDDFSVAVQTLMQAEVALELKDEANDEEIDSSVEDEIDEFMSEFFEEEEKQKIPEWYSQAYGHRTGRGYKIFKEDTSTFEGYLKELRKNVEILLQVSYDLAEIAVAKDDLDQGKILHLQVFTDRCKVLGKTHPLTLKSAETLAEILEKMGLPDQAQQLAMRFAELSQEVEEEEWEEQWEEAASKPKMDVNAPSHKQLPLDEDGEPTGLRFVYVDEHMCIGCTYCATVAKETFMMEEGAGRARAFAQGQEHPDTLAEAIDCCPVNCISYVDLEDLIIMETERDEGEGVDPMQIAVRGVGQCTTMQSSRSKLYNTDEAFCGNCPSNGCKRCPMFGVGLNPTYLKRKEEKEAKKKAREERKLAEALQTAAANMPLIFDSETVAEMMPGAEETEPSEEDMASDEDIDAEFASWMKQANTNDSNIQWQ